MDKNTNKRSLVFPRLPMHLDLVAIVFVRIVSLQRDDDDV